MKYVNLSISILLIITCTYLFYQNLKFKEAVSKFSDTAIMANVALKSINRMQKDIKGVEIQSERSNKLLKFEREKTSDMNDSLIQIRKDFVLVQSRLYRLQTTFSYVKDYVDSEMGKKYKRGINSPTVDSLSQDLKRINEQIAKCAGDIAGLRFEISNLRNTRYRR